MNLCFKICLLRKSPPNKASRKSIGIMHPTLGILHKSQAGSHAISFSADPLQGSGTDRSAQMDLYHEISELEMCMMYQ